MANNFAVIFAGGSGSRMHTKSRPKQFLEYNGKPIIIYTLELFDNHPMIDGIVVACVKDWIPFLEKMLKKFEINKVKKIIPGGATGQDSIYNGLVAARNLSEDDEDVVLIHDGVRPLITEQTIFDNINKVREEGSCITCIPATETFIVNQPDGSLEIPSRADSLIARAPQSFFLKDILAMHERAREEGRHDFTMTEIKEENGKIYSFIRDKWLVSTPEERVRQKLVRHLLDHYGYKLGKVIGPMENIKITTPTDFFVFKAMVEVHENQQIFGF